MIYTNQKITSNLNTTSEDGMLYDNSKYSLSSMYQKKLRKRKRSTIYWLILVLIIGPLGIFLHTKYFYIKLGHPYTYLFGLLAWIAFIVLMIVMIYLTYIYQRYLSSFHIKVYKDKMLIPTRKTLDACKGLRSYIYFDDVDTIYWRSGCPDYFLITFKPSKGSEYAPLKIEKELIRNKKEFLASLKHVVKVDTTTKIDFLEIYRNWKLNSRKKGIKWSKPLLYSD